jgi:hypothetical protein
MTSYLNTHKTMGALCPRQLTSYLQRVNLGHSHNEAVILHADEQRELDLIQLPHVQAVIYTPHTLPAWITEVGAAVRSGTFQIHRTILSSVTREMIEAWLESSISANVLPDAIRSALQEDILILVDRCAALTGACRFYFRAMTDVPNRRCGYHVDTVPQRLPPWGLLRVYCGPGTEYVEPRNVISMAEFYRYLSKRNGYVRQLHEVSQEGVGHAQKLAALAELDETPSFLYQPHERYVVPAGSIVALTHINIQLHWSDHAKELAWIHRSPMEGERRLLVSIAAR